MSKNLRLNFISLKPEVEQALSCVLAGCLLAVVLELPDLSTASECFYWSFDHSPQSTYGSPLLQALATGWSRKEMQQPPSSARQGAQKLS